jgi:hypothetical protein
MGLPKRRLVAGIVVILWVLLGPVGMVFSSCALMGGCGGACTLTSCLTPSLPTMALFVIGSVPTLPLKHPLMTMLKVPKPPPRSLPVSL